MEPRTAHYARVATATFGMLLAIALATSANAYVVVQSGSVTASVNVQGGGGATPVNAADSETDNSTAAVASASVALDTGHAVAEDGTGAFRGTGRGAASSSVSTSAAGLTLSGAATISALFEATPDLGIGSGIANADSEVFFRVVGTSVGYTFIGDLFDDYASPDQIQLRRLDVGPSGVPVELANSIFPNVNSTGTLDPGYYRLFTNLAASESGGAAQSPGSEDVSHTYSIEFAPGTDIVYTPASVPALGPLAMGLLAAMTAWTGARLQRTAKHVV